MAGGEECLVHACSSLTWDSETTVRRRNTTVANNLVKTDVRLIPLWIQHALRLPFLNKGMMVDSLHVSGTASCPRDGLAVKTLGLQSEGRRFESQQGHLFPPSSPSLSGCGWPGSASALVQPRLYGSRRWIDAMLMT